MDFLIDDYGRLKVLPVEVKSGKNYTEHSALSKFLQTPDYGIDRALVFSNERQIQHNNGVVYMPIYYCMFLQYNPIDEASVVLPELDIPEMM